MNVNNYVEYFVPKGEHRKANCKKRKAKKAHPYRGGAQITRIKYAQHCSENIKRFTTKEIKRKQLQKK